MRDPKTPLTRALALLCLGAALLAAPTAALAEARAQIVLVLDTSGSMKGNDPRFRSHLAAQITTDLTEDDDALGVLGISRDQPPIVALDRVADRRDAIKAQIKKRGYRGATHCAASVERALGQLTARPDPEARRFVIVLSDGECLERGPGDATARMDAELAELLGRASEAEVRIFTIGLGQAFKADSTATAYLDRLAEGTLGRRFHARTAQELPAIFATIAGLTRGSQSRTFSAEPGEVELAVEPYVRRLTVVMTPEEGGRAALDGLIGPDGQPAADVTRIADTNRAGLPYLVVRIDRPTPGAWTLKTRGTRTIHAAVVQTFDLQVALEPLPDEVAEGEPLTVTARLEDGGGQPVAPDFASAVTLTLNHRAPGAHRFERAGAMRLGEPGRFTLTVTPKQRGRHTFYGHATRAGVLDATTRQVSTRAIAAPEPPPTPKPPPKPPEPPPLKLAVALKGDRIDLGTLEPGERREVALDLRGSTVTRAQAVRLVDERVEDDRATWSPSQLELTPEALRPTLTLAVDEGHEGGEREGALLLVAEGREEVQVAIPVRYAVRRLTFWERWGTLLLFTGAGLLGILLLIGVVYGFVSPHDFPPHLRLFWGSTQERFARNQMPLQTIRGAKRGFYRNARFTLGGPRGALGQGGPVLLRFEATGRQEITVTIPPGTTLLRVSRFDSDDTRPVEEDSPVLIPGQVFQVGELFFKIE